MRKEEIRTAFETIMPTPAQKDKMLGAILAPRSTRPLGLLKRKRWACFNAAAACLALIFTMTYALPAGSKAAAFGVSVVIGGDNVVSLGMERSEDGEAVQSISYVDNGPELSFFITGTDIAKIELSSENEFVKALDFTKTLDEKYWNPDLYYEKIEIDGIEYQYVPARSGFEPSLTLTFPEGFSEYDEVWYSWYGWNLREWAEQDDCAHIQGVDGLSAAETQKLLEDASEEEKLAIAAGGGSYSAAGHILVDGYPEEKLTDQVVITITDREGNTVSRRLRINVGNNLLGQMVVSAGLVEE